LGNELTFSENNDVLSFFNFMEELDEGDGGIGDFYFEHGVGVLACLGT
jgi:hypothetical protein